MAGPRLSIRIDLASGKRIGPGKIALLEAIRSTGSISAGARALGMSYRRAWLLVEEINNALREPAVTAETGRRCARAKRSHRALGGAGSIARAAFRSFAPRAGVSTRDRICPDEFV